MRERSERVVLFTPASAVNRGASHLPWVLDDLCMLEGPIARAIADKSCLGAQTTKDAVELGARRLENQRCPFAWRAARHAARVQGSSEASAEQHGKRVCSMDAVRVGGRAEGEGWCSVRDACEVWHAGARTLIPRTRASAITQWPRGRRWGRRRAGGVEWVGGGLAGGSPEATSARGGVGGSCRHVAKHWYRPATRLCARALEQAVSPRQRSLAYVTFFAQAWQAQETFG